MCHHASIACWKHNPFIPGASSLRLPALSGRQFPLVLLGDPAVQGLELQGGGILCMMIGGALLRSVSPNGWTAEAAEQQRQRR